MTHLISSKIDGFLVAKPPQLPPVTKSGMKEYLLELVVDADLVRKIALSPFFNHFQQIFNSLFDLLNAHPSCGLSTISVHALSPLMSLDERVLVMPSLRKSSGLTRLTRNSLL